jgi:hypothetical protein
MKKLVLLINLISIVKISFSQPISRFDSIIISNQRVRMDKPLDIKQYLNPNFLYIIDSVAKVQKKNIAGRVYYCLWSIRHDSLFLNDIEFTDYWNDKLKSFKNVQFQKGVCFSNKLMDTIYINSGKLIRPLLNGKGISEKSRIISIYNGVVNTDSMYNNLITDPKKQKRTDVSELALSLKKILNDSINWGLIKKNSKKDKSTYFDFKIKIDETGKISKVTPWPDYQNQTQIELSKIFITFNGGFELLLKEGKPISELVSVSVELKLRSKKISVKCNWL